MNTTVNHDEIDELFAGRFAEGLTPGLVWGVVAGGEVIHHGALGSVSIERDELPTVDSVFRIASMSKSFTAAAILLLRDRGLLRLDDPAVQYVPELTDPAITVRSLLTMGAGLLTDDPWGDRQESLPYDEFGVLLASGFTTGRAPGLGFEYSNLGFALLGRIVTNITGDNLSFVEAELLTPLSMTASHYDHAAYQPGTAGPALVAGHVKRTSGWVALEPAPPGAFSAMGGLHSSVRDLAKWVNGFVQAFGDEPDGHPLSQRSRQEMQQLHRFAVVDASIETTADGRALGAHAIGYGFGLFVEHDAHLGHLVHHSGGYPGYGSRMVWHPASGVGVVTLSNGTYAGAYKQAHDAVKALVRARRVRTPQPRVAAIRDWVATITARLVAFDPDRPWIDAALMSENVALDTPDEERRAHIAKAREQVGTPLPQAEPELYSRAMAHAAWVVPAERGRYEIEILLAPEPSPRLQTITVNGIPHAREDTLERAQRALAGDPAAQLRGFGEPVLIPEPVTTGGTSTEFLVQAGNTWWKATVTSDQMTFEAHPVSTYPRLQWLARQLGHQS